MGAGLFSTEWIRERTPSVRGRTTDRFQPQKGAFEAIGQTSFPMAVQRKPDETVVFSWIVWPSRKVRDEDIKKAMKDPRMNHDPANMPFDGGSA